ncbi:MAG TPA: hypothetical protein VL049_28705 [Candidatus Dormibacteraeota bacterium]|nr:hypothetical protein [Candidatus Dormibacteraeota bacterium]
MASAKKRAGAKRGGTKRDKTATAKKPAVKKKAAAAVSVSRAAVRGVVAEGVVAADDGGSNEDKRTIEIKGVGPLPRVAIQVTQLQLGEYSVSLWDRNGMNPKEVARGTNDDDIADEFPIVAEVADLPALDGFTMFWVVWIKALQFGPGARYFVSVSVTQGGTEVVRFERQGPMSKKFLPFHGEWTLRIV